MYLNWVPLFERFSTGLAALLIGMELLALGTWMYMKSTLGSGPRDALMVVLYSVLLFFAMTVQTSTVSMILCALAFLSLLGKKPLSRFEQRLSVPVLGLLAFAIVYGAAAI